MLEFISHAADRDAAVAELRRLVAPGGYMYIATPRPRLREYHSRAWLGDLRRRRGMPWASPPWQVRGWGRGWHHVDVSAHVAARAARRLPVVPKRAIAGALKPVLPVVSAWQKLLFRRPA